MRSLREKLKAVSSAPTSTSKPIQKPREDAFFMREHSIPLHVLCGVERTTLEEIRACDPLFSGDHWDISKLLFLDTETTGLSGGAGTIAFQIGLGYIERDQMVIRQYVMRDYSEEAAMLTQIASLLAGFDTLVTFNGKSFDIPLLESRMIMHRIRVNVTAWPHLDLLHACRRVYKLRLGRCNLASLEEAVLGDTRDHDLPGAQVPQRYFDYLKTGEFTLLEDVLRHNLQDVQSLASLTGHLCSAFRDPEQVVHAEDLLGISKTLERGGQREKARKCYHILGKSTLSAQARMRLSLSYKRDRQWDDAVCALQSMIAAGEGGIWPYIEMAKYCEHVTGDIPRALSFSNAALLRALNLSVLCADDEKQIEALRLRIARLKRKEKRIQSQNRRNPS